MILTHITYVQWKEPLCNLLSLFFHKRSSISVQVRGVDSQGFTEISDKNNLREVLSVMGSCRSSQSQLLPAPPEVSHAYLRAFRSERAVCPCVCECVWPSDLGVQSAGRRKDPRRAHAVPIGSGNCNALSAVG